MDIDIEAVRRRLDELESELGDESVVSDRKRYTKCTREHSHLSEILDISVQRGVILSDQINNQELVKTEVDGEFLAMLEEEKEQLEKKRIELEQKLEDLLVPPSEDDDTSTILELRAGAGGQEAALFVADCVRMYQMYAIKMKWKVEQLSATLSDMGGFKECCLIFSGKNAWRFLRHEAGTHRVQRVPETESQGRVHTSTITVAALKEADEGSEEVEISDKDLRIEATRSSGAGGQHVNTTDSAVRITHLPTGIAVFCQEERSQHKNKDKAMRHLRAKVTAIEEQKRKSEVDSLRQQQVGSGDRSEKIRTYNFSQNRISDHRMQMTRYDLDRVMNGDLDLFSKALVSWFQKELQAANPYSWILL